MAKEHDSTLNDPMVVPSNEHCTNDTGQCIGEGHTDEDDVGTSRHHSVGPAGNESNSLMNEIKQTFDSEEDFLEDLNNMMNPEPTNKVLGVGYDIKTDMLFIKVGDKEKKEVITKRDLLSWIASVYDPLGFVSPYILKGRIFFQQVNERKLGWNDPVPNDILKPFNAWKNSIPHLKKIRIPRWTSTLGMEHARTEMIICSDASKYGYGIAVYLKKSLIGRGDSHISFYFAKSHVVPVSMMKFPLENAEDHCDSIPKLELCAAKLAAVYRDVLSRQSGEFFHRIHMMTDSKTVLLWLADWEKRFKTFINFRVQYIRMMTKVSDWMYIPSECNPADVCSKGLNADDDKRWRLFHNGPKMFQQDSDSWRSGIQTTAVASDASGISNSTHGATESAAAAEQPNSLPMEPKESQSLSSSLAAMDIEVSEIEDLGQIYADAEISPIQLFAIDSTIEGVERIPLEIKKEPFTPWPIRLAAKRSTWLGKVRAIAWVIRGIMRLKEKIDARKRPEVMSRLRPRNRPPRPDITRINALTVEEKERAEILLVKAIQSVHFEKEVTTLLKLGVFAPNSMKELKSKTSRLANLSPFLDEHNIMRAAGRHAKADHLPRDFKFSIIMPNANDENIQALIRHTHFANNHCTQVETHYLLKRKWLILGGKTAVFRVLSCCVRCQRTQKSPATPKMGDLPAERLRTTPPFFSVGIDCLGPLYTRHGRGTQKKWVLMCTCFTTRAVHLLPLRDMTTSTVINALTRLISQYPAVRNIFSDRGSNFIGAEREMREAKAQWDNERLTDKLSDMGVKWTFGPANCGHAGGLWERVIGLTKKMIKATVGNEVMNVDVFETLIASIAGVLNRRPLTAVSANVDDKMALSPAHFLYPYLFSASSTTTLPPTADHGNVLRSSWRATRKLLDDFWEQWIHEYIPMLRKRCKWVNSSDNGPRVGQLCLLVDQLTPREEWRLVRIEKIISSDENHPRRVIAKDSTGSEFDRHVRQIIPLELDIKDV